MLNTSDLYSPRIIAYINRIKNDDKRAYAEAYYNSKLFGQVLYKPVLSVMARQAVELNINQMLQKESI